MSVLLVLLASLLAGCKNDPVVEIATWTVEAPGRPPETVTLPAHLDGRVADRETLVLRTRVSLPESFQQKPLTLAFPMLCSLGTLEVDGVPLERIDPDAMERYRSFSQAFRVPVSGPRGEVEILLRLPNSSGLALHIDAAPRLSATVTGDAAYRRMKAWNQLSAAVGIGMFLAGLVLFGGLAVVLRRPPDAWFAIQQALGLVWVLGFMGWWQWLLGENDLRFAGACFVGAIYASLAFTKVYFGLGPVGRGWKVLLGSAALAIAASPGPFTTITTIGVAMAFVTIPYCGYQIVVIGRIARAKGPLRSPAILLLLAWAFLLIVPFPDNARGLGFRDPTGGWSFSVLAYSLALVCFLAMLALEHIAALRNAVALNVKLEGSVRHLDVTNQELRRQVSERSRELSEMLARVGAIEGRRPALEAGALVDDRYRVVKKLGAGAMGDVFEVERIADGRRLALKTVKEARTGAILSRFAREAQIAAQLAHPNLVGVVDVGVDASGEMFLVMELVDGAPLEDARGRFGNIDWALPILRDVAAGLSALHAGSIVHRDLKPANVLLTREGRAKISDFGIAALRDEVDAQGATVALEDDRTVAARAKLTQAGAVLGTPLYMAPELARGAAATQAADVFALGIVAHELLTGSGPFDVPPILAAMAGRPIDPAPAIPNIAPTLARVLAACLSVAPEARPRVTAVLGALEEVLRLELH